MWGVVADAWVRAAVSPIHVWHLGGARVAGEGLTIASEATEVVDCVSATLDTCIANLLTSSATCDES